MAHRGFAAGNNPGKSIDKNPSPRLKINFCKAIYWTPRQRELSILFIYLLFYYFYTFTITYVLQTGGSFLLFTWGFLNLNHSWWTVKLIHIPWSKLKLEAFLLNIFMGIFWPHEKLYQLLPHYCNIQVRGSYAHHTSSHTPKETPLNVGRSSSLSQKDLERLK